jgi:folate-binding protein YgfZ
LQVTDQDRLKFLHNQSTNNIILLQPGQGCDTVFVTSTGRTLDLASVYVAEESVIVQVSPNRREQLLKWLDRYIFFSDKVKLTDITADTAAYRVIGAGSGEALGVLADISGVPRPTLPTEAGQHQEMTLAGVTVRLAVGCGLALPGYTLFCAAADAPALKQALTMAAILMEESDWQALRVLQGRPEADAELTEDYNPLEAGLWHTISFNKGCYIGQETIARLNTYQGVKQQLWGIQLSEPVEPGTLVQLEGNKVGECTSCTTTQKGDVQGAFALAYVKTKAGGEGLQVQLGPQAGTLVDLPFLTRQPSA